jgi:hypothetical protein
MLNTLVSKMKTLSPLIVLAIVVAVAIMVLYKSESAPQAMSAPEGSASTIEGLEQPAAVDEPAPKKEANDDTLTSADLLPAEDKNAIEFANMAPSVDGSLSDQNFLTAGHLQGEMSTVSKNANYGLRSEPPNPQDKVSPWMNTSIKPDTLRRPLC